MASIYASTVLFSDGHSTLIKRYMEKGVVARYILDILPLLSWQLCL